MDSWHHPNDTNITVLQRCLGVAQQGFQVVQQLLPCLQALDDNFESLLHTIETESLEAAEEALVPAYCVVVKVSSYFVTWGGLLEKEVDGVATGRLSTTRYACPAGNIPTQFSRCCAHADLQICRLALLDVQLYVTC